MKNNLYNLLPRPVSRDIITLYTHILLTKQEYREKFKQSLTDTITKCYLQSKQTPGISFHDIAKDIAEHFLANFFTEEEQGKDFSEFLQNLHVEQATIKQLMRGSRRMIETYIHETGELRPWTMEECIELNKLPFFVRGKRNRDGKLYPDMESFVLHLTNVGNHIFDLKNGAAYIGNKWLTMEELFEHYLYSFDFEHYYRCGVSMEIPKNNGHEMDTFFPNRFFGNRIESQGIE